MTGTGFGHALGPSRALPGLPIAPLVERYGELLAAQQGLGLRHLGELLVPPGGRLRVLDGVFAVEGRGRRHVGAGVLRGLAGGAGASGAGSAAGAWAGGGSARAVLLERLAGIQERDPAALRRILLYQLVQLLHEHPRGDRPEAAAALGIDPGEAAALAQAAARRPRLDAGQRAAAEQLEDVWLAGRVRAAAACAAVLPPAGGDPLLAGRLAEVAERVRAVDALLEEARRAEERGGGEERERAAARYAAAARLAWDCPRAVRGLVRTHRPVSAEPGAAGAAGPLEAVLTADGVTLRRPRETGPGPGPGPDPDAYTAGSDPQGSWRVVRLTRGEPVAAPLTQLRGDPATGPVRDPAAPLGRQVRYVALPVPRPGPHPDRAPGGAWWPLISRVLLVAPEAQLPAVADGCARIGASWLRPAGASGVEVTLTGPDGREVPLPPVSPETGPAAPGPGAAGGSVAAGSGLAQPREGVVVRGLAVGGYVLRVRCRYAAGAGREVLSGGVRLAVRVHAWPEAVTSLDARPRDGGGSGVRLRWAGGAGAEVRFVQWPGDGPAEGAELAAADVPPPLPWVEADGVAHPPPGTLTVVRAVALLGERALAGPGAAVEAPEPVTRLAAHRTTAGRARISFDWPDHAGRVIVAATAEPSGERTEHPVVRAVFLREGLELPVGPGAVRITAYAAPRSAHATVAVPAGAEEVLLPADIAIAYRVLPGPRRMLRRGPAVLRVTLLAPGGDPGAGLPDFVLVAREGGDGDRTARPHRPADGVELCRVAGSELAAAGTVEREIDPRRPRGGPYAVRGFLLGGRAASVRLDEPSLTSLVVR
ncbi:hypothetical protein ABZ924_28600 [Streptomyces sp. NPDC046876]|uniref:hypothetical protein n=1 Tax=Streptomyces sp. NPDC046876 TaxID=3155616 RepID=UPI0033EE0D4E